MPVVLTTIPSGAIIDADTLRTLVLDVETYVNEAIASTDRGSTWLTSNHVYRPDFYGSPDPRTTLVSGEHQFRSRGIADPERAFFSAFLGAGPFPVPGLNVTAEIPETLNVGSVYYRAILQASFYAYEWGGSDDNMDESLANNQACTFKVAVNGVTQDTFASLPIWKGSQTETRYISAFYPRKQCSAVWASAGLGADLRVGVNDIGIVVDVEPVRPAGATLICKHIIVQQGNVNFRHWIR